MKHEQKKQIVKWVCYALYLLLLFLLQVTPGVFPAIFGVKPVFLLPAVICAAMFEGEFRGSILAVVAGLLWDTSRLRPFGYSAILLLIFACLCGLLIVYFMRNNVLTALLYCFGGFMVYELIDWLIFFVPYSNGDAIQALYQVVLPRIVYSMLFVPLFYWLSSKLAKRLAVEPQ